MKNQAARIEKERQKRYQEDAQMLNAIGAWPAWPWLPVKRNSNDRNKYPMGEPGIVHADDVGTTHVRVYDINLFQIKTWFPEKDWKFQMYTSNAQMLDAGWTVD